MSNQLYKNIVSFKKQHEYSLPEAAIARRFVHQLFETLLITKHEVDNNEFEIEAQLQKSEKQLRLLLYPVLNTQEAAHEQAAAFFAALPELYTLLLQDVEAIYKADPAAKNINEVLIAYPSLFAIAVHRIAHQLHRQQIPLLPRILNEYAHSKTGIDIHPGATIGHSFAIDHGTGIVIGETAVIGNHVVIYQGVTLGGLNTSKEAASGKRHPTIEDNVVIYAGATILGGNTIIGHDSVIGGNVWLTQSVAPFSEVFHSAEITVQKKQFLSIAHHASL